MKTATLPSSVLTKSLVLVDTLSYYESVPSTMQYLAARHVPVALLEAKLLDVALFAATSKADDVPEEALWKVIDDSTCTKEHLPYDSELIHFARTIVERYFQTWASLRGKALVDAHRVGYRGNSLVIEVTTHVE